MMFSPPFAIAFACVAVVLIVWAARSGSRHKGAADRQHDAATVEARRLEAADPDRRLVAQSRSFGVQLDLAADTVTAQGQAAGRFTGSLARVETEGQLTARVTVTRLVAFGFLAFGARKKVDQRVLYLTVEGDGFQLVVRLNPTKGTLARQFAAAYNTRSGALTQTPAPTGVPGIASELESLAKLHADEALTDEEYATAKARLLGTSQPPAARSEPEDRRW